MFLKEDHTISIEHNIFRFDSFDSFYGIWDIAKIEIGLLLLVPRRQVADIPHSMKLTEKFVLPLADSVTLVEILREDTLKITQS